MMKNLFLLFCLITYGITTAQELDAQPVIGEIGSMNDLFSKQLKSKSGNELTGNPYLYKEWKKNGIIISDGKNYPYHAINYDIYKDQVVVFKSKDSVFIINKELIDSFIVENRRFSQYNRSFYEDLYNGNKVSLLKRYEAKVVEGMFNPTDATRQPDRLNIMDDYYAKKGDQISHLSTSKKSISEIFGVSQGDLKAYLKNNNLSYKNEKDLIKIFEHYNQM